MKRLFLCIILAISALMLASCGRAAADVPLDTVNESDEAQFTAQITEINGDSVLLAPLPEEEILSSSDLISISAKELDDIGANVGDTVTVTYSGGVMESYPAQVIAIKWELIESGGDELPEEAEPTEVTFEEDGAYIAISLPSGWTYSTATLAESRDIAKCGITFWPEAEPAAAYSLEYWQDGFGLCGTGVTFKEMEFENGLTATACTEEIDGGWLWYMLIYNDTAADYILSYTSGLDLWDTYEQELMEILETVRFEK